MPNMMKLSLMSVGLWAALSCASQAEIPNAIGEDVQASLRASVDQGARIGVVLAYIDNGAIHYFTYGHTSVDQGEALTPDSLMEIGSITKVFTAYALVAQSLDQTLSLDTPLSAIWPEELSAQTITLGELASHRAALSRQLPQSVLDANSVEALLHSINSGEAMSEAKQYSNTSMALLAAALSHTAETPYADFVGEAVLSPLALSHTTYHVSATDTLAHPHQDRLDMFGARAQTVDIAYGAGGLYSNARDLAHFVSLNLAPDATHSTLITTVLEGYRDYPLGWQIHDDGTRQIYHHSGEGNGYQAFIGFRRDTGQGVVLMTNSTHQDPLYNVALHVLDPRVPLPMTYSATPSPDTTRFEPYLGRYIIVGDEGGNDIHVRYIDGRLAYIEQAQDGTIIRRAPLQEEETGVFNIRGIPAQLIFTDTGEAHLRVQDTVYPLQKQPEAP